MLNDPHQCPICGWRNDRNDVPPMQFEVMDNHLRTHGPKDWLPALMAARRFGLAQTAAIMEFEQAVSEQPPVSDATGTEPLPRCPVCQSSHQPSEPHKGPRQSPRQAEPRG